MEGKSVYLPPAKIKLFKDALADKRSEKYQRLSWQLLKKTINGLVNKTNSSNLPKIIRELFKENLIRGQGVFVQSIMKAQSFGPSFTNVFAALVAVVNSKLPQIGRILVARLISKFKKSYHRNEKQSCLISGQFIAHLINQEVISEIVGLEILFIILKNPTGDSVEVAVGFLKECGAKLQFSSPKGLATIFDILRNILNECNIDTRVQYSIEVLMTIRKDGFKDYPIIIPELDLLEEGDKITHEFELEDDLETKEELNVFRYDPDFLENEEKYKTFRKEILDDDGDTDDDDDDDDDGDDDDDEEEDEDEEGDGEKVIDETATDLVALRRKLYLILQSSLVPEEAAHKLVKLGLEGKNRKEMCFTIIDCCAQQRTYIKFYSLIAQNFCSISNEFINIFSSIFVDCFSKIDRFLDSIKLRNVGGFFSHLLIYDSIPWTVLSCIKLNEDDTTSASRVFIKIIFQEICDYLGIEKVKARIKDPTLEEAFSGIFPRDNPRDTRFSVMFFQNIGLHPLVEDLIVFLKSKPTVADPIEAIKEEEESEEEKPIVEKKVKRKHKESRDKSHKKSKKSKKSR